MLAILAIAFTLTLVTAPAASWAADSSGNQALNRAVVLVAPEPDTKISVYLQPEANKSRAGYGINGDAVTILEQVSDNQSVTWNHIRFDNPPYAEGWVQAEFVSPGAAATPNQSQSTSSSNAYLGNRQSQTNQRSQFAQSQTNRQNSTQSYSHQNQN